MKQETIQKANDIIREIQSLESHVNEIKSPSNGYSTIILKPKDSNNHGPRNLRVAFLPMSADQLMHLYLITLEAKIESLKKELEDLKD